MTRKSSAAAPILTAVLILALPLAAYVAAYFWLGAFSESIDEPMALDGTMFHARYCERAFGTHWEAAIFQPAGKAESWWRGTDVQVRGPDVWIP